MPWFSRTARRTREALAALQGRGSGLWRSADGHVPAGEAKSGSVEDLVREGDSQRDAQCFAAAAEAYGRASRRAPERTDIRVQHGNMLKDSGRPAEAEAVYRDALAQAPDNADLHLQLGHALKLQGRRAAAIDLYRRAAELAPYLPEPMQELARLGYRPAQEALFEAQLRSGGIDALREIAHRLLDLRGEIDRIAAMLPDVQTQLAFPLGCYDRLRESFDMPAAPPAAPLRFSIVLLADREGLETLRAQIAAVSAQTHGDWVLRAVGRDGSRRRAVEQLAAAEPRIAWVQIPDGETEAAAEHRVALGCQMGWILLLSRAAILHRFALAWFCAAAERTEANAFVADEEAVTWSGERARYSAPQFRQAVDYDTLLECNPFGETIAITGDAYSAFADRLAVPSVAAARGSLLLNLAHAGQVGHIPCALTARGMGVVDASANPEFDLEQTAAAHRAAVAAHLHAIGAEARVTIARSDPASGRLTIRWRPGVPDLPITVIVATRDNGGDLRRFVDSLYARAGLPQALRVLVVDNGTEQPESRRILAELGERPGIRVLRLDQPFNWSNLNNRAAAEADTPLIVFANDDMLMLSRHWDEVLRGLLDRPEIGAVSAKLLYPDDTIQSGGILFGWPGAPIHDGLYADRDEPGAAERFRVTRATAAADGAFLATRRSVFRESGPFDAAGLPVNYSDIDFSLKLRAAGLKVLWTPDIVAYHYEGKSRGLDHLDREKLARQEAERAVLRARWGAVLDVDPSLNPIWRQASLPFCLLEMPSTARLWRHIRLCASANPWLPDRGLVE